MPGCSLNRKTACVCDVGLGANVLMHSRRPFLSFPAAASTDGTARVWDMEIGDCVLMLEGHQGPVTDLAASSDSSILVTASADQTARVWSLEKGQCTAVLAGHTGMLHGVAVDPHGRFAVTASADGTARVWDLGSGQCAHVLAGHSNSATGTGALGTAIHLRIAMS